MINYIHDPCNGYRISRLAQFWLMGEYKDL